MTDQRERTIRPVFFVHVMKTGGTTLYRYLRETLGKEELYPDPQLDFRYDGQRLDLRHHLSVSYLASLSPERRRRIRVYTGHFPYITPEILGGDFFTLTILRDPVERTISLLRQFKRRAPWVQDPARRPTLADATLEEVYANPAVFEPLVLNHQTKIFSMQRSDPPESYLDVVDVDEARLDRAKANLAAVDIVGVTERYDAFLDEVEATLGWQVEPEARANETPADEMHPVTESLRCRIAADNALDIELYRYAKELIDLRQARRTIA